ncbi:oligosaccharide flippase family protein [Shewanella atlantica]|uniref:oligosaccharide flippase family protein n=1 Tax=Shewanella atlantica TaxID=271099 RepID=UPI0037351624
MSSILNFIVLARLLTSQEFGNLRQLMLLNQIVFAVLFAAIPISLLYFCGRFSEAADKKSVARKHLVLILGCGVLSSFCILIFKSGLSSVYGNPSLYELLRVFFIFPLFYMIYNAVPAFLIALDRTSLIKWYCPLVAFINTAVILLVATFASFSAVLNTLVVTAGISAVIALCLLGWLTRGQQTSSECRDKELTYSDIVGYSWFLVAAALISILGSKIDQFVISNKLGLEVFAIYVVGAFQVPIYSLIQSSVNSVMLPQLTSHIVNNEWGKLRQLWRDSVDKISLVALPLAAFLTVFSFEFITLVFGKQYGAAAQIFLVFSLLAPIKCISFGLIFRASGKPQYDVIGALAFLALSTTLTFAGVTLWGELGVALGVVVATLLLALLMSVLVKVHTKGEVGFFDLLPGFFFYRFIGWVSLFFVVKNIIEWAEF